MPIIIQANHEENIRNHQFKEIAEILRNGKISELSIHTLRLLADYLDGKLDKKRGGQTGDFGDDEAERIYSIFQSLTTYGCTPSERIKLIEPVVMDRDEMRKVYLDLEKNSMTKTAAYKIISEESLSLMGRSLSPEAIRKIIRRGEEISINEVDTSSPDFY